jgi:long-subunit acyl-CoA synthetase (AMP-forming)
MEKYKVRQVPDQSGRILRSVGNTLEIHDWQRPSASADYKCQLLAVEREVARRSETLKAHGFENSSRLAVSGAYEPDLILIALAALTLGGAVLPAGSASSSRR